MRTNVKMETLEHGIEHRVEHGVTSVIHWANCLVIGT